MKNTRNRRIRKLSFSCSTPRNGKTMNNTDPNLTSYLFRDFLDSLYTSLAGRVTPELLILVSTAVFLLIERFFTTILIILSKLSLQNWRCSNVHRPLPRMLDKWPAMMQAMMPARKRLVPSCIFTCSDLDKRTNRLGFQPKYFTRRRLFYVPAHIGPAPWAVPSCLRPQPSSTCISNPWLHNHVDCHSSTASTL